MTRSRLMRGRVYHERLSPKRHAFSMASAWAWFDLDELPGLLERSSLWSARECALLRFRREDYLGGAAAGQAGAAPADLKRAVLDQLELRLGAVPERPRVRLLTHVRALGYVFNPVSFYFVYDDPSGDPRDERLVAILAEITNTPWGQRHDYLLDGDRARPGDELCFDFAKRFHVSPFFPLDQLWRWRFRLPGPDDERLEVHMTDIEEGREVFHAGMALEGVQVTERSLRRAALDFPWKTLRVHAAIYLHAAILWLKRVPFFANPHDDRGAPERTPAIPPANRRPRPSPSPAPPKPLTTTP